MEILIVIIILAILIEASRMLFAMPSKYIVESEQCTNTVHGEVSKFFWEAITGKSSKEHTGTIPEQYSILFK